MNLLNSLLIFSYLLCALCSMNVAVETEPKLKGRWIVVIGLAWPLACIAGLVLSLYTCFKNVFIRVKNW